MGSGPEVVYFDGLGRAEAIRLALHIGGVPFKDTRVAVADWPALRDSGRLPLKQLPLLVVQGPRPLHPATVQPYPPRLPLL